MLCESEMLIMLLFWKQTPHSAKKREQFSARDIERRCAPSRRENRLALGCQWRRGWIGAGWTGKRPN